MKKKLLKLAEAVFFVGGFSIAFSINASAYIDPSVMTYAIQAGAGIVIAIGAVVGIYWRKARKKVSEKLGVDENRNKEVEADDIILKAEIKEEINK